MFPSIQVQFTDPCLNRSSKICHIPRVHKVQPVYPLILILFLQKTLHFRKALCWKHFRDWTNHFFQLPKELGDLVNKGNLIHKYLPKQTDIDEILEVIQRKVLKGTHLLVEIKEIQAGNLHRSYFKDLYLSQNKLPSPKSVIKRRDTCRKIYSTTLTII